VRYAIAAAREKSCEALRVMKGSFELRDYTELMLRQAVIVRGMCAGEQAAVSTSMAGRSACSAE
jgi:hypothetical protein